MKDALAKARGESDRQAQVVLVKLERPALVVAMVMLDDRGTGATPCVASAVTHRPRILDACGALYAITMSSSTRSVGESRRRMSRRCRRRRILLLGATTDLTTVIDRSLLIDRSPRLADRQAGRQHSPPSGSTEHCRHQNKGHGALAVPLLCWRRSQRSDRLALALSVSSRVESSRVVSTTVDRLTSMLWRFDG